MSFFQACQGTAVTLPAGKLPFYIVGGIAPGEPGLVLGNRPGTAAYHAPPMPTPALKIGRPPPTTMGRPMNGFTNMALVLPPILNPRAG